MNFKIFFFVTSSANATCSAKVDLMLSNKPTVALNLLFNYLLFIISQWGSFTDDRGGDQKPERIWHLVSFPGIFDRCRDGEENQRSRQEHKVITLSMTYSVNKPNPIYSNFLAFLSTANGVGVGDTVITMSGHAVMHLCFVSGRCLRNCQLDCFHIANTSWNLLL